jgi:hypothetical protein
MDIVYLEALESQIKKYKYKITHKLSQISLDSNNLGNHSDLLCMVLDYSPVIKSEPKRIGIFFYITIRKI